MTAKRKTHTAAFKAQVALAAVKGDRTVNELAAQFGVHPTLIHGWKKQLLAGAEQVFAGGAKAAATGDDRTPELYEQIGRLKVELDWVKKARPANVTGSEPSSGIACGASQEGSPCPRRRSRPSRPSPAT
jgi:putative transposase